MSTKLISITFLFKPYWCSIFISFSMDLDLASRYLARRIKIYWSSWPRINYVSLFGHEHPRRLQIKTQPLLSLLALPSSTSCCQASSLPTRSDSQHYFFAWMPWGTPYFLNIVYFHIWELLRALLRVCDLHLFQWLSSACSYLLEGLSRCDRFILPSSWDLPPV